MMSVWLTLRADLARRWRPVLTLALLLGLAGGIVLSAAAGARRTATAYPRLLSWASAAQLTIVPGAQGLTSSGTGRAGFYQALARLPDVDSMSTVALLGMGIPVHGAMPDLNVNAMGSVNGALGVTADRVKILAGRLPDPADPRAALVDPQLAAREHLRPGSILHLFGVPHYTTSAVLGHLIPLTFRVSAIVRFDDQIVPANGASATPRVVLTPAFTRQAAVRSFTGGDYAGVRLRPGASPAAFRRAATALAFRFRGTKLHPGTMGRLQVISNDGQVSVTERAIEPEVIALLAFAVLAGVIGLAVTGQLLARQLLLDAVEFPVLRALGMTRSRLATLILARAGVATAGGAAIAVAIAAATSPLMPIGPARLAEPSPGIEVNLALLAAGATAILLLPLALVSPIAWRAAGAGSRVSPVPAVREHRAPSAARALSLAGSAAGDIGVRMAFEPGRGRSAVPVRSALAATALAVAAVAAALVFGASLIGLVTTPHRYGQNWAQEVDFSVPAAPRQFAASVMASQPDTVGYALGLYGTVRIAGHTVPAIGVDPVRGSGFVSMLAGRPPAALDEIALGGRTLREMHLRLGDRVPVSIRRHRYRLRIVGEPVFASFSEGADAATSLGEGAQLPARLLSAAYAAPAFAPAGCLHGTVTCYSFILMRQAPGTILATANARLQAALAKADCVNCASLSTDQRPKDIRDYAGVRDTPLVLSGVLAMLAAGALSHVLLTSIRRRRRDLALLKTLGMTRRQVLGVVAWQASALAATALGTGLPLGLVAGRWAWVIFARSAGVSDAAVVPLPLVLLVVPALLLIVNLIVLGPARTAARLRPAAVLRTE